MSGHVSEGDDVLVKVQAVNICTLLQLSQNGNLANACQRDAVLLLAGLQFLDSYELFCDAVDSLVHGSRRP